MEEYPGMNLPRPPRAFFLTRPIFWIAVFVAVILLALIQAHAEVQADPRPVVWTSCSSTIASGGVAQYAPLTHPAQPFRAFIIQNPAAATESLFVDMSGVASTTTGVSLELKAGESLTFMSNVIFSGSMSVNAVTTAHAFGCKYGL